MPEYPLTDEDRVATRLVLAGPSGISAKELDEAAQQHLLFVVDRFLERHPKPIAVRLQQDATLPRVGGIGLTSILRDRDSLLYWLPERGTPLVPTTPMSPRTRESRRSMTPQR